MGSTTLGDLGINIGCSSRSSLRKCNTRRLFHTVESAQNQKADFPLQIFPIARFDCTLERIYTSKHQIQSGGFSVKQMKRHVHITFPDRSKHDLDPKTCRHENLLAFHERTAKALNPMCAPLGTHVLDPVRKYKTFDCLETRCSTFTDANKKDYDKATHLDTKRFWNDPQVTVFDLAKPYLGQFASCMGTTLGTIIGGDACLRRGTSLGMRLKLGSCSCSCAACISSHGMPMAAVITFLVASAWASGLAGEERRLILENTTRLILEKQKPPHSKLRPTARVPN